MFMNLSLCVSTNIIVTNTAWKEFFLVRIFQYLEFNLRIQSEYGKIRTRKTLYLDSFHTVQ